MNRHFGNCLKDKIFDMTQVQREQYISNKQVVFYTTDYAYCLVCKIGHYSTVKTHKNIKAWASEHSKSICKDKFDSIASVFSNPKKSIKVGKPKNATSGLFGDVKEEFENMKSDLEDIREERNGLQEDLANYKKHHEEDIAYCEEQTDITERLPEKLSRKEMDYLCSKTKEELIILYEELYQKSRIEKLQIHTNYSKRFSWDDEED
jgi:hypothetical protein